MRRAAGLAHRGDLVVKCGPVAVEHMGAGDDDVDLVRALTHRITDLGQPQVQRHQPRRKARGDRCNRNPRPGQRLHGGGNHRGIDADRPGMQPLQAPAPP